MNEQQAIQRLKNGDIGGLEFLVMCYQKKAVRTAYLITRDLGLAEEIVQEAFIQAYRAIHGFDETRPFEPWFMRSVANAAVKTMQRSARHIQVGDEADEFALAVAEQPTNTAWVELAARVESVESQVEFIEVQNQIWDAMQKLSPRQRAVIVQRYFLEMSEAEMAKESRVAAGTIKWLLNAARGRLYGLLERKQG